MVIDTTIHQLRLDTASVTQLYHLLQNAKPESGIQWKDFLPVLIALITSGVGAYILWKTNKKNVETSFRLATKNSQLEQHNLWATEFRKAAAKFITANELLAEGNRMYYYIGISISETHRALAKSPGDEWLTRILKGYEDDKNELFKNYDSTDKERHISDQELKILINSKDPINGKLFPLAVKINDLSKDILTLAPAHSKISSQDFDKKAKDIIGTQDHLCTELRDEVHKIIELHFKKLMKE